MLAPIEIDPRTFLRQHCSLPALPEVVTKIQKAIHDDTVDIDRVARLIGSDPSLLAQLLKVVNSAYYGLPTEISRPQVAIAFLGLNEVYRMVLSLSVINALTAGDKTEVNSFWHHSAYTATCAKYLALKYEPQVSLEDLWSAAILHDIGKLVYLKMFPDHYHALSNFCSENGCLFSEAERLLSLPPSTLMGTLLCDHWRLPDNIREACEAHTLRDLLGVEAEKPITPLQRRICLANLLAVLAADSLGATTKQEIADAVRKALDLSEAEFLSVMGEVVGLKKDVEELLGQFR